MKVLAVVHVGSVNGVVHDTSKTAQQEPLKYELQGSVLDVCRQILTQTVVCETEPYTIKVTKDALDDDSSCSSSFESLRLVPDSVCFTVCNGDTHLLIVCLMGTM